MSWGKRESKSHNRLVLESKEGNATSLLCCICVQAEQRLDPGQVLFFQTNYSVVAGGSSPCSVECPGLGLPGTGLLSN